MSTLIELIDTYLLNYNKYNIGKVEFECEYGELVFYKNNSTTLILHGICIFPEHRQKGLCRDILHYLIDKGSQNFKQLCIQSVLSKILYEYLLRFEYKNKQFLNKQIGFCIKL
jgi:hypothetical protein